jgi:UDP-N-acetylmuramoylalanine-D-glutamate ligase
MGIKEKDIKKAVQNFNGIEGRLQFVREIKGIKIYNDNNSTTPDATIAALRALGDLKKRKIILIVGGDDKKLIDLWYQLRTINNTSSSGLSSIQREVSSLNLKVQELSSKMQKTDIKTKIINLNLSIL